MNKLLVSTNIILLITCGILYFLKCDSDYFSNYWHSEYQYMQGKYYRDIEAKKINKNVHETL